MIRPVYKTKEGNPHEIRAGLPVNIPPAKSAMRKLGMDISVGTGDEVNPLSHFY